MLTLMHGAAHEWAHALCVWLSCAWRQPMSLLSFFCERSSFSTRRMRSVRRIEITEPPVEADSNARIA